MFKEVAEGMVASLGRHGKSSEGVDMMQQFCRCVQLRSQGTKLSIHKRKMGYSVRQRARFIL